MISEIVVSMLKAILNILKGDDKDLKTRVECAKNIIEELIKHLEKRPQEAVIGSLSDDLDEDAAEAQQDLLA